MKEYQEFLEYIQEARDEFVLKVNHQQWITEMRTAAESLLIAYDQLRERYRIIKEIQANDEQEILRLRTELRRMVEAGPDISLRKNPLTPEELAQADDSEVLKVGIQNAIDWMSKHRQHLTGTGGPVSMLKELLNP